MRADHQAVPDFNSRPHQIEPTRDECSEEPDLKFHCLNRLSQAPLRQLLRQPETMELLTAKALKPLHFELKNQAKKYGTRTGYRPDPILEKSRGLRRRGNELNMYEVAITNGAPESPSTMKGWS